MNDVTQLILTSGLVFLLGFLTLILPLLYLIGGPFKSWLEANLLSPQSTSSALPVRSAPSARRKVMQRSTAGSRKAAVSRTRAGKPAAASSKPRKKAAKAKSTSKAATKSTSKRKVTKKAASKKPAAKKIAARKSAATKPAPAGAKRDPKLGVIYTKKPAEVDDLKKISGVAKVLEGKLHAQGIYTYRQIADWKNDQMNAFGELLSFKNRIQRDEWKKQAAALHKEKYS